MEAVKWLGENVCDICRERGVSDPTVKGKYAYDGPTVMGPWAFMCRNCWNTYGRKTMGQEYKKDDNGEFVLNKHIGASKTVSFTEEELYI